MSNQKKMLMALPLAALFASVALHMPSASAADKKGMVVARDPQTGQLRAPTPAERQALTAQRMAPMAAQAAPAQPMLVTRTDAVQQVRLGQKGQVYAIVTRDADGKLVNQCVQGEAAAQAALAAPTRTNEEHNHEDR
jgi:hypothetical protein